MANIPLEEVVRFEDGKLAARNAWVSIRLWCEENPIAEGELVRQASAELKHALDLLDAVKIEPTDEDNEYP
jgi:hypothetical protein